MREIFIIMIIYILTNIQKFLVDQIPELAAISVDKDSADYWHLRKLKKNLEVELQAKGLKFCLKITPAKIFQLD